MKDLSELLEEENRICFESFNEQVSWELGSRAADFCRKEQLPVAIRIERDEQILFQAALPGSCRDNDLWLAGKARIVRHFRHSSFYISRKLIQSNSDISKYSLDPALYRAKGGGVPLFLKDGTIAGVLIISGLKDVDDHNLAVRICREYLKAKSLPSDDI
ncbi:MAG: heme-binding protein [Spirochaetales bacterium]|nr:heme-binding protein [Spirochaetales bacterium]